MGARRFNDIQEFILQNVEEKPSRIIQLTKEKFQVSQQAVQKQMASLIQQNLIEKQGKTRGAQYALTHSKALKPLTTGYMDVLSSTKGQILDHRRFHYEASKFRHTHDEQRIWNEVLKERFSHAPKNIQGLFEYGFTRMVNNVRYHSEADNLMIEYKIAGDKCSVGVRDDGVGIFHRIQKALELEYAREAILHLSKGKLTTDPDKYTGAGIFFSSRLFDHFSISSHGLGYQRINLAQDEDWFVNNDIEKSQGTHVQMELDLNSKRSLEEVFSRYAPGEDLSFSRTHIGVELGLIPGETYISRSQARRILSGLDKFKFVTFDFRRISTVGQGFVDEVFRVFKNQHPKIELNYVHANDNVEFMIRRSLG